MIPRLNRGLAGDLYAFKAIHDDLEPIKLLGMHHKTATTLPQCGHGIPELDTDWNLGDSWLIHTLSS